MSVASCNCALLLAEHSFARARACEREAAVPSAPFRVLVKVTSVDVSIDPRRLCLPKACHSLARSVRTRHDVQGSLVGADEDYRGALGASALFWHAQRSGAVTDTLVPWRGSSGLSDVPVGGFYEGSSAQRACAVHAACLGPGKPHKVPCACTPGIAPCSPYGLPAGCITWTHIPGQGLAAQTAASTCICGGTQSE